jgi:hypothetical protein
MVATSKGFAKGYTTPPDRINQMRSNDWSVGSNNKGSSILRAAHARRSPSPSRTATAADTVGKCSPQRNPNKGNNIAEVRSSILSRGLSTPQEGGGKHSPQRNPNKGNNIAEVRSSILSRGSTPQERFQNMQKSNVGRGGGGGGGYSSNNTDDSDLLKKFEDAFNTTLRNNPGILPGAPTVIESIKSTMFEVQQINAAKEAELRKQLDQAQGEMSKMEHQISQQMGEISRKKSEYSKEIDAMDAAKKDLKQKIDEATTDKEEMVKHLSFLSKSRMEIEKALEAEVKKVEKDRDALKKVVQERKQIQKVKEENQSLEDEVDRMSKEANIQNQALQLRKEELKKLEERNRTLRNENEAKMRELEMEQKGLLEITEQIHAKKKVLLESKKASQKEMNELESELARAKFSSPNQVVQRRVRTLDNYMTNSSGGTGHIVESDVRPFELRTEDVIDGALRSYIGAQEDVPPTHFRNRSILEARQDEEEEFVEIPSRSRSLSRSTKSSRRSKSSSKRKQEDKMKKQIDDLRLELEAVRARNNIAMHDQEKRDAEYALRADIRTNLHMSSPSAAYGHHRDHRDHEERYHSFLHKDRERVASPAWRRRSSTYSDRVTRSGGGYRSRYWE